MPRSHCFLLSTLLAAVLLSGCYAHTYRTEQQPAMATANYDTWHHHLIGGLITLSDDLRLEEICPQGVAVVHNRLTFVNWLVSAITAGIYTPSTVRIWCATRGGQAEMHEVEMHVTPEYIERARLIIPDFEEQLAILHAELSSDADH